MAELTNNKSQKVMRGTVTREDVARVAGVAGSTVSLALRGDTRVRPETSRLVKEVAERLNYRPLASARALSSGRTHTIAVVFSHHVIPTAESFNAYSIALHSICSALMRHNYHMSLVATPQGSSSNGQPCSARFLQENAVDGALLFLQPDLPLAQMMARESTPCVVIDDGPSDNLVCVFQDECRAAELAVAHMVSLGHKRILYAARNRPACRARAFEQGYLRGMAAAGLPACAGWDGGEWGDYSPVSGYLGGILEILRGPNAPTAIITYDTEDGANLIGYLIRQGLAVPAEVSVAALQNIGCTTNRDHGLSIMPSITCTANAQEQMATMAVDRLLALIEHPSDNEAGAVVLEPKLISGASTGPCPARKENLALAR